MVLYIHVPFCYKKCYYCAFYSLPIGEKKTYSHYIQDYVTTLNQEISFWSKTYTFQPITAIFFGGGTPSILQPKEIKKILDNIIKQYPVTSQAEVTLETNPESLQTKEQAKEYIDAGINRFSLGFQSLDDQELASLGRTHTAQKALHTYKILREAQCNNINTDLIWGLPNQTLKQWLKTLQKTINLNPNHLSLYNLTIEDNTLFKKNQKALNLPEEQEQVQMYLQTVSLVTKSGLKQYEISNFAQDGFQCIQNNAYWSRTNYLGLGPSATSTILPYRWTNPTSFSSWKNNIKNKKTPPKDYLDSVTQAQEILMLGLRTTKGFSIHEYNKKTGYNFLSTYKELITPMIEDKMMELNNTQIKLTPKGMLISNTILQKLFEKIPKKDVIQQKD